MRLDLLATLAVFLALLWHPAAAADSLPGQACTDEGAFHRSGGSELGGAVHFLICSDGTYQPAISFTSAANLTTIGAQTCATGQVLKFDGAKWACASDAGAAVPGNHREILFNDNGSIATDSGLVFASSGALTAASAALTGGVKIGDVATCDASAVGTIRYSAVDTIEYCADNGGSPAWSAMTLAGMPTGAIAAFEDTVCPAGWAEYTAARGRFLRGLDNGAGLDPAGTRTPGGLQTDTLQNITGSFIHRAFKGGAETIWTETGAFQSASTSTTGNDVETAGVVRALRKTNFDASAVARTSTETRPLNVAVIFCQYTGSGGGGSADNLGNHAATQNIVLGSHWISADGDDEGIALSSAGYVGIGTPAPTHILHIDGVGRSTSSTWATSSDRRVKENIQPLAEGLDTLMRLRPVSFDYIDAYKNGKDGMDGKMRGFIAQEVEEIVPEMVKTVDEKFAGQEITDFRLLNNADFTPILVNAVQQLKAANDNQAAEITALRADIQGLKAHTGYGTHKAAFGLGAAAGAAVMAGALALHKRRRTRTNNKGGT